MEPFTYFKLLHQLKKAIKITFPIICISTSKNLILEAFNAKITLSTGDFLFNLIYLC